MIHFKREDDDTEGERDLFQEPWAQMFPDKTARMLTFVIYYGSSFVKYVHAVSVDGHRTLLPLPKSMDNLMVSDWDYCFAKILDRDPAGAYGLDLRMKEAGFSIES